VGSLRDGSFRARLPEASSVALESSRPFQSFAPMEVVATAASVAEMLSRHHAAAGDRSEHVLVRRPLRPFRRPF
jgi:hypothetical protein